MGEKLETVIIGPVMSTRWFSERTDHLFRAQR